MPCSQQHAALVFSWPLVSLLPAMGRVWCWDAMTHRSPSMLGLLSVPSAHLIQHEYMWVSALLLSSTSLHPCAIFLVFLLNLFLFKLQLLRHEISWKPTRRNGQPFSVADAISCLAGHHVGTVDPLRCVVSSWDWTVCLVLHRRIDSQRAGSLWEQLHQRAGVCVFVWGWVGILECVCLNLSDSDVHMWS